MLCALATLLSGCAMQPPVSTHVAALPPAPPPARRISLVPVPPAPTLLPVPDLWQRFTAGRHWQPCQPTANVERWIRRYAPKPGRFGATLQPMLPAMDYVLTHAEQRGLPSEIMLVPYVESHYRADARGPAGALGMWQLMPDTARRFGLVARGAGDDRVDLQRSTDAALSLLKLHSEAFSARPKLMFAAYNAGAYRLRKALAGHEHERLDDLDALGLPRITREYVDKIKALSCLLGEPARFGVQLPPLSADARLVAVTTPHPVNPRTLAATIGIAETDLRHWNQRAYTRGASDAGSSLLLPRSAALVANHLLASGALPVAQARAHAHQMPAAVVDARIHRVSSGDSLWTISRRYRVGLADLMRWNKLNKHSVLRIGQTVQLRGSSS
ncbi:MAG: transglycosylase SLT domain-containing protein [Xanthomonadales bacterium]|nr:Membrane-bound lytic murein transglycosylase D [Xanthomonadales bacterium]MCC6591786.1 transglycosylase SLT domain-containing protein [Xanthomonadales bacterium]MCE7930225.1 LysM peptidoglycan-binding domain-containing protein [Xanthomonadales bacterium PRO6]